MAELDAGLVKNSMAGSSFQLRPPFSATVGVAPGNYMMLQGNSADFEIFQEDDGLLSISAQERWVEEGDMTLHATKMFGDSDSWVSIKGNGNKITSTGVDHLRIQGIENEGELAKIKSLSQQGENGSVSVKGDVDLLSVGGFANTVHSDSDVKLGVLMMGGGNQAYIDGNVSDFLASGPSNTLDVDGRVGNLIAVGNANFVNDVTLGNQYHYGRPQLQVIHTEPQAGQPSFSTFDDTRIKSITGSDWPEDVILEDVNILRNFDLGTGDDRVSLTGDYSVVKHHSEFDTGILGVDGKPLVFPRAVSVKMPNGKTKGVMANNVWVNGEGHHFNEVTNQWEVGDPENKYSTEPDRIDPSKKEKQFEMPNQNA